MNRLVAGVLLFSAAAFAAQVSQQNVTGDCNVALGVNQGKVEVQCGLHEGALKPLADKLNKIQKEQKLIGKEVESLVSSVNLLMSLVIGGQNKIIAEIRDASGTQTQQLARLMEAMEKTVTQQVDRVIPQIPQQGGEAVERFKQEARVWRKQYEELLSKWTGVQGDEEAKTALAALQAGDLASAGKILDQILSAQDSITEKSAPNHFNRGRVFELEFKPREALEQYDAAYRYAPKNLEYSDTYAVLLQKQNQFRKAARVFEDNLEVLRKLAQKTPDAYEPDVANTLNNLGLLYSDTQRFAEAEKAYLEARDLYRKLAQKTPDAYEPNLAAVLNNLGVLYGDTQRFADAEKAYLEALGFYKKFAEKNPTVYQKDVQRIERLIAQLRNVQNPASEAVQAAPESR